MEEAKKFIAIKKFKGNGGEGTEEYFYSLQDALAYIRNRPAPEDKSWTWWIGEYA